MTETKVKAQVENSEAIRCPRKKGLSGKGCRTKGAAGEREALRFLEELFQVPTHTLKRNQNQTAFGGADCIDLPYFALEVKRCAELNLTQWWAQTLNQAEAHKRFPLLLYRVDRQRSWTLVVSLEYILKYSLRLGATSGLSKEALSLSCPFDSPVAMTPEAFRGHLIHVGLYLEIREQLLSEEQSNDKGSCSVNQGEAG